LPPGFDFFDFGATDPPGFGFGRFGIGSPFRVVGYCFGSLKNPPYSGFPIYRFPAGTFVPGAAKGGFKVSDRFGFFDGACHDPLPLPLN